MNKEDEKKIIRYRDLPPHLQRKYKNSPIFAKQSRECVKKFDFDLEKLRARQAEKQKTMEEKLEEFQINSTEEKYLDKVFKYLSAPHGHKYFSENEVSAVLRRLGSKMGRK